ncbi:hypothetical protein BDV06DRAFT_235798 [Aspergillus oleicola]
MAFSEHHSTDKIAASGYHNGYPRITQSSPVRNLGPGCMDYERCAALHNELLTRAVKGLGLEMPSKPRTWWEVFSPSEDIVDILCEPLIEFLKRAYDTEILSGRGFLFYFLGFFRTPKGLLEGAEHSFDAGRYLKIYESSHFMGWDDEGLLFDQNTLTATWISDYNLTPDVCRHEWGWMPLELSLIRICRCMTKEKPRHSRPMKPWVIHRYTDTEIDKAVTALKRLIDAIDSRIENKNAYTYKDLPWHDPATLWKVAFRCIAPGIRLPTASEFLDQPIKVFSDSPYRHLGQFPGNCPLRLFQIDAHNPVHDTEYNINILPGFYIDPVMPWFSGFWSNGCRLLLPFGIGANGWARESNGQPFGINFSSDSPKPSNTHLSLYQGGTTNGITNKHYVQIDKVLNNWAERVEVGDWEVTEDGVAGGIEKFREADTEEHWKKYWIPPSW